MALSDVCGSSVDQVGDGDGLGRQRRMARVELDELTRVHPLRHLAFVVGMDHSIGRRHLVPGWLGFPRWVGHHVAKGGRQRRLLRHGHDQRIIRAHVLAEALMEFVLLDPKVPIGVRRNVLERSRWHLLADLPGAFTSVRGECGNVDEARDVRQGASFGNHRATVRVSDQDDRAIDLPDHRAGPLRVVGE